MPYITHPIGNNNISYEKRKEHGSACKLRIHTIEQILDIDEVQKGSKIVFEEINNNKIATKTGLSKLYHISPKTEAAKYIGPSKDIWIMDNHNYALYAWFDYWSKNNKKTNNKIKVIHIDAHADMGKPMHDRKCDIHRINESTLSHVWDYAITATTVGSFIQPAVDSGLISDCIQIRSSYALEHLTLEADITYILDIDLDFRVDQKVIPQNHLTVIKNIATSHNISCITIATSPYFLDQEKAIHFLHQLKPILQSTS